MSALRKEERKWERSLNMNGKKTDVFEIRDRRHSARAHADIHARHDAGKRGLAGDIAGSSGGGRSVYFDVYRCGMPARAQPGFADKREPHAVYDSVSGLYDSRGENSGCSLPDSSDGGTFLPERFFFASLPIWQQTAASDRFFEIFKNVY